MIQTTTPQTKSNPGAAVPHTGTVNASYLDGIRGELTRFEEWLKTVDAKKHPVTVNVTLMELSNHVSDYVEVWVNPDED